MQYKYLNVTSDDLWRIRDKQDGKKSSLGKTYKMNKEANDKIYDLNQQAIQEFGDPCVAVLEL